MFVGQVDRGMKERGAFQEIDYRAVFGSMTKWTAEIDDGSRMAEFVSRAFHQASAGRPGPVVLALPEDMLSDQVEIPDAPAFSAIEPAPQPLKTFNLLPFSQQPNNHSSSLAGPGGRLRPAPTSGNSQKHTNCPSSPAIAGCRCSIHCIRNMLAISESARIPS